MLSFVTSNLLWSEGYIILLILGAAAILGWFFSRILLALAFLTFIFCFHFFRNPDRICKEALDNPDVIICPTDGTVVSISYDPFNGYEGYPQKVAIFLSALDVHVNWIPISGIITKVLHKPGSKIPAILPKSSELNERNDVQITAPDGRSILLRQITGIIARRIACWVKEGQSVTAGQKYGMMKFGSRLEVMLPKNVHIEVGAGQKVYGGQTVLGRWPDFAKASAGRL